MKNIIKNPILTFILGVILSGGIVYAATMLASDVEFNNTNTNLSANNVQDAIEELYTKANSNSGSKSTCLFISNAYGQKNNVGAKYVCDLGDGIARNFYILATDNNIVKLLMEKNLSDEIGNNKIMSWDDAIHFFDEGHDGYGIKQTWTNVLAVDLPSAQDIGNAGYITNFNVNTSPYAGAGTYTFGAGTKNNYVWLYNYSRGCYNYGCTSGSDYYPNTDEYPWGYWTKDIVVDNSHIWVVHRQGMLYNTDLSNSSYGVRPVITISKSQLAN